MVALHELRDAGGHVDPRGVSRPLRPEFVRAARHLADASTVLDLHHRRRFRPLRRRDDAGGRLFGRPQTAAGPAPGGPAARLPIPRRPRPALPEDDDARRHSPFRVRRIHDRTARHPRGDAWRLGSNVSQLHAGQAPHPRTEKRDAATPRVHAEDVPRCVSRLWSDADPIDPRAARLSPDSITVGGSGAMNPITSIASLSGDLLLVVIAGLVFVEETGIPIPFAPGDLLLIIAGVAIASDTVDAVPMVSALLLATILGAMVGREVFAAVGRPALLKAADALGFRPALNRTTDLLQRRGAPAVFIGRLIPGLRITTTQVAGVSKISRFAFAAGLIPSVVVYIAIFVGLGALLGQPAVRMFHRAEHRFFVVTVTVLAALAVILSVRWLARRGALSALDPIVLGVRRELADTIDLAIVFTGAILILTAVSGLATVELILDPEGLVLLGVIALAYRVPIEARTGQTIGKTLMGISVYGPDGVPGWWRAIVRNLVGVLLPLWPADAVLLLRSRQRQRLGDRLSGTTIRRVAR